MLLRWIPALALVALTLGQLACSEPAPEGSADTGTTTTTPDAGGNPAPLPMPVARMDEAQRGTSHTVTILGKVTEHGRPSWEEGPNPFEAEGVTPARFIDVVSTDGSSGRLYYTLPEPYGFRAAPNTQAKLFYRERFAGANLGSSYGARLEMLTGELVALFEDGTHGPALDEAERVGFSFELDPQPASAETVECGKRVHYPVLVTNGARKKRLFGGESALFDLASGQVVKLTLFDAWRIEDDTCGGQPAFSIGYLVVPE
jgi:hypothetical protein